MTKLDLVLVGGGLASGILALTLLQRRPDLDFLVLEAGEAAGGNHTWCFHEEDLTAAQRELVAPLVTQRWLGQSVIFPAYRRDLRQAYCSIASSRFAEVLGKALGPRLRLRENVVSFGPDAIELEGGERIAARCVIDARGFRSSPAMAIRFQSFLGRELRFHRPHGVSCPIIMDATTPQDDGYRFTYVLPLADDVALVEDTGYMDGGALDAGALEERVADYCRRHGWQEAETLRTERGVLPITLAGDIERFWSEAAPVPRIGLAGSFFHPTTGYSLPDAVRVAETIAALPDLASGPVFACLRDLSTRLWHDRRLYRGLNRMLFLAGSPEKRWQVMQRFYTLPDFLIARFYADRLTLLDKLRILTGKPPVPIGGAVAALLAERRLMEAA